MPERLRVVTSPRPRRAGAICLSLLLFAVHAAAINNNREVTRPPPADGSGGQVIPYGFYNAGTGLAVAAVFLGKGYVQPQVLTVANAFVGTTGSYNVFLANTDIKIPGADRLYVDQAAMYSEWDTVDSYQDGNPKYTGERAGSNGSDADNYIEAEGDDLFLHFNFKYLLPIGHGREPPPHQFRLNNGILEPLTAAGGGSGWNPLATGRTILELRPFYRKQGFRDADTGLSSENETAGLKFTIEYDNTDWYNNPTSGTNQRLTWAEDRGWIDSNRTWNALQFRHSQYWNLGDSASALGRVLAFDAWTSHSFSWNETKTGDDGKPVFQRPPLFEGSTLGGLERQRGFPSNRFHDRSAVNYTLEYRHVPRWNPLPELPLLNRLFIPWWQWVAFVEVGRVNDQYELDDLHSNMKMTIGGSVRALVYELVVRADFGVTQEGAEVQMFFNHPF